MPHEEEVLKEEAVLSAMHEDVIWANGMEGGYVRGRDEVVEVRQVVRDRSGTGHIFHFENGLIKRFDIRAE